MLASAWCRTLVRSQWHVRWTIGIAIGSRGAGVERSASRMAPCAPLQVTLIPSGSTSGLLWSASTSGRCRPHGLCGRGGAGPGQEGPTHQRLPTDRTALWRRFSPPLASALPVDRRGCLHRPLAQLLPTQRQLLSLTVGIQTPAAHQHGSGALQCSWPKLMEPIRSRSGARFW